MTIDAYHLPAAVSGFETEPLSFAEVTLRVPRVTPSLLAEVIRHLESARERLRKRRAEDIAAVLAEVFRRWRDRTEPLRHAAEAALPAVTRFSQGMVAHGLDLVCGGYRPEAFKDLLEALGGGDALEGFVGRRTPSSRAYGPAVTAHVLAGNIPGVGLPGVVTSILLGSASLVKTASADPLFPALWAASVARQDPEIGDCLAVLTWRGGRTDLEAAVFDRVDAVVAYGSDRTIQDLRARVRCRFLGHGHRVSLGAVGRDVLSQAEEIADRAAYDASLFDQQGCLSPHCVYVEEGGSIGPRDFAVLVASALARWAERLPPGSLTPEEAVAIRTFRAGYEARGLAGKDVTLFVSPRGLDWTVIYEGDPAFTPSCLFRTVVVKPVPDLAELASLLRPWGPYLQAAGVAVTAERAGSLADMLGQAGVSRICPIGRMQIPPLTWHQDGRVLLQDLVRWTDVEIERGR